MAARSGIEIMIGTVIKALGIDGDKVMAMVAGVQQTVLNADARLSRIENNQRRLMDHFAIEEIEHDGQNQPTRKFLG